MHTTTAGLTLRAGLCALCCVLAPAQAFLAASPSLRAARGASSAQCSLVSTPVHPRCPPRGPQAEPLGGLRMQFGKQLPKNIKDAVTQLRGSIQAALSGRCSRMDVEMPYAANFGVEVRGASWRPTVGALDRPSPAFRISACGVDTRRRVLSPPASLTQHLTLAGP